MSGFRVFISYSHRDEALRSELRDQLASLEHEGLVAAWDDRLIKAGECWRQRIDERLDSAHVVLLMVTARFIASKYAYGIEMKRALARASQGQRVVVIPVIAAPCQWQTLPLGELQTVPADGEPPGAGAEARDAHFARVAGELRQRLVGLREQWGPSAGGAPGAEAGAPGRVEGARSGEAARPIGVDGAGGALAGAPVGEGLGEAARRTARVEGVATARRGRGPLVVAMLVVLLALAACAGEYYREVRATAGWRRELYRSRAADSVPGLEALCARAWLTDTACALADLAKAASELERPTAGRARAAQQARSTVEGVIARSPDEPVARLLEAQLDLMNGDATASRARIVAIVAAQPAYAEAAYVLGADDLLNGRFADAVRWLDQAVGHAPESWVYRGARGAARLRIGDAAGAVEDLERAARDGGLLASQVDLAMAMWADGRLAEARAALDAARTGAADDVVLSRGANAQPWTLEARAAPGSVASVTVTEAEEKRCVVRLALAVMDGQLDGESREGCGPDREAIAAAVAQAWSRRRR